MRRRQQADTSEQSGEGHAGGEIRSIHLTKIDFLKSLEVFVYVANAGSMTSAARILGITQSAVSQHIRHLEDDLNQRLIDRTKRPMQLTTAGFALRNMAVQFIGEASEIRSSIRRMGDSAINHLRIAVIGSLAGTLVPLLVRGLTDQFNVRHVSVRRGQATSRKNALLRREADLLVTSDPMLEVDNLERYELYSEPFILLTPSHPEHRSASLNELAAKLPLIRYTSEFITGRVIESHLRRLRLEPGHTLEFDSTRDIIAMISAGRGWSITTPSSVLHGKQPGDRVRLAPLPGPGFQRTIMIIVRANELGHMPAQFAEMSCQVIRNDFLPRIYQLAPFLRGQLLVGPQDGEPDTMPPTDLSSRSLVSRTG